VPKRCPVSTEMRDGKCISVSAVAPEPESKTKPKDSKEGDDDEHHRGCGRGTVRTHSGGCVIARRRLPAIPAPPGFGQYYRTYQFPGNSASNPPN